MPCIAALVLQHLISWTREKITTELVQIRCVKSIYAGGNIPCPITTLDSSRPRGLTSSSAGDVRGSDEDQVSSLSRDTRTHSRKYGGHVHRHGRSTAEP